MEDWGEEEEEEEEEGVGRVTKLLTLMFLLGQACRRERRLPLSEMETNIPLGRGVKMCEKEMQASPTVGV